MTKRGMGFWDVLAWIVLFLIFLWLVLKVSGVIKSPALLEYSPLFGVVYLAGWAMSVLVRATQDINKVQRNLGFLNNKFNDVDKSVEIIKSNCKYCK